MGGQAVTRKSQAGVGAASSEPPSSAPSGHLLPPGEKGQVGVAELGGATGADVNLASGGTAAEELGGPTPGAPDLDQSLTPGFPSPLVGEGGSDHRSETDEGGAALDRTAESGAHSRSDKPHRQTERRNRGFAKSMRKNPTETERQMWRVLKDRRLAAYKFRRQVPIGPYIADFVCYSVRLIIELDGSQHAESGTDAARDEWLAAKGFEVLRIRNDQLISNRDGVFDTVWHKLEERKDG